MGSVGDVDLLLSNYEHCEFGGSGPGPEGVELEDRLDAPTVGYGEPAERPSAAPAPGIPSAMVGPEGAHWQVIDYGQYLHPTGPDATLLRQALDLPPGAPEAGQCMLLS